jgi:phosphate-selective porin OprO/OprP
MTRLKLHAVLLLGAATLLLSNSAFAQNDTTPLPKHRHHHNATSGSDRLDLLEHRLEQQAEEIHQQAGEIQALKAQVGIAPAAAPPQVTADQFQALQSEVHETAAAEKKQAVIAFTPQTPYQHQKSQPTISSRDGRWTFSPVVMVQGDYASYSKGQPLSTAGTDNLKSAGENIRRARIGFQGTFDKDFGYAFIYDFGGSNGDESYQAYAGAHSGGSVYTASTGQGTGPHIYAGWVSYKGFLNPFTFRVGLMSPPANLGDATQSDDLLFNERPSPSQISRALDADESREAVGFIGNGDIWNASLFLTGDTFGKGALIAPQTTYGGGQEAVVGRVAIAPWQDKATNFNVHLGANFGYVAHPQESTSTSSPYATTYGIGFSDRPELRVDNVTFLNTGTINATSAYSAGLEGAASWGPLLVQGENFWYGIERNSPAGLTNPRFSGWYVEGSWVITGEGHQYNMANASFVRPSPANPFDPSNGDWGAWEIAARYSSTNLDYDITSAVKNEAIFGGIQNIWSAGLNFYPNDILRFMLDFQHVQLANIGSLGNNGQYDTINIRTQVSF